MNILEKKNIFTLQLLLLMDSSFLVHFQMDEQELLERGHLDRMDLLFQLLLLLFCKGVLQYDEFSNRRQNKRINIILTK